ncbi:MAG: rod shape-determining protein [Allosphingosinicella sp.]
MMNYFRRDAAFESADVAIDFGTANMMIAEAGASILFDEPSLCCFVEDGGRPRLFAAGTDAHAIRERTGGGYRITRPLRQGVMSDIDSGRELLRYAVHRTGRRRMFSRASAIVGVPADATQAERQALLTAVRDAGLAKARLYDEPLMAAIGAGIQVEEPRGRMVVDCGAGTTEVAIISLGSICVSKSVRIGGDTLDEAIVHHFHAHHRFEIGLRTAEAVKLELAALHAGEGEGTRTIEVSGMDDASRLPGRLSVPVHELLALVSRHVATIVEAVRSALSEAAPELSRDILDDGVTLTGGSSTIALLPHGISAGTGLRVQIADRPRDCVALGLSGLLQGRR